MKRTTRSLAIAAISASLLLPLSGCKVDLSEEPELRTNPKVLTETWGMEVPPSMKTVDARGVDFGPHGEALIYWIMTIDQSERTGYWDLVNFTEPLSLRMHTRAEAIIEATEMELPQERIDRLVCRDAQKDEENNFLLACWDPSTSEYVMFEEIF